MGLAYVDISEQPVFLRPGAQNEFFMVQKNFVFATSSVSFNDCVRRGGSAWIVQEINKYTTESNCSNGELQTSTDRYWEAWELTPRYFSALDYRRFNFRKSFVGKATLGSLGSVAAYCWEWQEPYDSPRTWQRGAHPDAGELPSTLSPPSFFGAFILKQKAYFSVKYENCPGARGADVGTIVKIRSIWDTRMPAYETLSKDEQVTVFGPSRAVAPR
jgi:hypothetical protein